MSKSAKRYAKKPVKVEDYSYPRVIKISPKTEAQKQYINVIYGNELVFCTGGAGTGKTHIATSLACQALENKSVERIILTRPAVTSGENLGYLPGMLSEKYRPYLEPFEPIFQQHFGISHTENLLSSGKILPKPIGFLRGVTFTNSFVILDEAQNTSIAQMKLFLTRIGHGCKIVVDGDIEQKDIKTTSGLAYAIDRLEKLDNIGVVNFTLLIVSEVNWLKIF
jgi:phosphate starvation-inducible PhoH-like protein